MNKKIVSLVLLFFILCLCFNSCYTYYSPLPSDFGGGTYYAHLLGEEGIVLSTVENDPEKLEGFYEYQGKVHYIYVELHLRLHGEGADALIYDAESHEMLASVLFNCNENQIILYEVIRYNDPPKIDFFELYESSPIILEKYGS